MKRLSAFLLSVLFLISSAACSDDDEKSGGSKKSAYEKELVGQWDDSGVTWTFEKNGDCDCLYVSSDGYYTNHPSGTWMVTALDGKYLLTTQMSDYVYDRSILIVTLEGGIFEGIRTKNLGQVKWRKL